MKKLKLVAFVFAGLAIGMVSCTKSASSPSSSTSSSSSVIYSNWIQLNMTNQGPVDSLGDTLYSQSLTASAITSSFLDQGVILSYIGALGSGSSGTDTAVFTIAEASTYFGLLTQQFLPGEIDLLAYTNYSYSNGFLYRYVLIPGSVLTTNSILKNYTLQELKAANYSTITKALATGNTKTTN